MVNNKSSIFKNVLIFFLLIVVTVLILIAIIISGFKNEDYFNSTNTISYTDVFAGHDDISIPLETERYSPSNTIFRTKDSLLQVAKQLEQTQAIKITVPYKGEDWLIVESNTEKGVSLAIIENITNSWQNAEDGYYYYAINGLTKKVDGGKYAEGVVLWPVHLASMVMIDDNGRELENIIPGQWYETDNAAYEDFVAFYDYASKIYGLAYTQKLNTIVLHTGFIYEEPPLSEEMQVIITIQNGMVQVHVL